MKALTISKLARLHGLSRSTLLYYDRIKLLPPSGRMPSGYRFYTAADEKRLKKICGFRQAGLSLADIRNLLSTRTQRSTRIFAERLEAIGSEILDLRNQQRLLTGLMRKAASGKLPASVDKAMWVEMLRAAGMDAKAMNRWHTEFERRAPHAHQEFLMSLGIPEKEIRMIRQWSAKARPGARPTASAR
ncbi:MAG TPA: MerR family transcriptional regulator [Kiritimatiellia bacterium]|nr:MerR family transcriptional regulator [Kiritimatiellia bacterium]